MEILYGYHPVLEALRAGRRTITEIYLSGKKNNRHDAIAALAQKRKIPVQRLSMEAAGKKSGTDKHQGVAALASPLPIADTESLVKRYTDNPAGKILLMIDGIQDPHNLGALIRTGVCFGAAGVIIPKDRAASATPAVSKASAGALEHVHIARATNLVQTLRGMKTKNIWIVGADAGASQPLYECDMSGLLTLVIGGEDKGLRQLVRQQCDFLVSIPQSERINSLNASVAGSILMYEVFRQRQRHPHPSTAKNFS